MLAYVIIFFTIYAIYFEVKEQCHSYEAGKPKQGDKLKICLEKIKCCLTYDMKTIKWRRSLIASTVIIILVFLLVHKRKPELNEMLLYIIICFVVMHVNWKTYTSMVSTEAITYGLENIKKLKI